MHAHPYTHTYTEELACSNYISCATITPFSLLPSSILTQHIDVRKKHKLDTILTDYKPVEVGCDNCGTDYYVHIMCDTYM